jgi:hypothetical protein
MAAYEIISLVEGTPQLRAPGTGDTYSAPRALAITPETLTGSAATSGLSLAQTWNTTGQPTLIYGRVTNTASNISSGLLDVGTVAGGSMLFCRVDGSVTAKSSLAVGTPGGNLSIVLATGGGPNGLSLVSTGGVGWVSSTTQAFGAPDLILARDAANTLAQRNGTNGQTSNTYGTYTDASNYRRAALAMTSAGVATLKAEGAGTGASGNVLHISSLPTSNPGPGILWNNAGTPAIGT